MPGPRVEPFVCLGCGAVSDKDGKRLPSKCECDEPNRVPVLPTSVSHLDPVEKIPGTDKPMPNQYALRVKRRLAADAAYLHLQAIHGHAVAATTVCREMGHDARAMQCERCGARTERVLEES